jgi:hypothetical protein
MKAQLYTVEVSTTHGAILTPPIVYKSIEDAEKAKKLIDWFLAIPLGDQDDEPNEIGVVGVAV